MDENGIFMSNLMLKLTNGFQKRLTFNVTDRSADFNDCNMHIIVLVIPVKTAFNLIGNMRDNLNSTTAIISVAFFL